MQATGSRRRFPVGIQTFSEIRKDGYLYVDKTELIWRLVNEGSKFNYLSRPRRFGKSLLVDTLNCYFNGKKELFDGLKIMGLETEWGARPVIRLDMSGAGESLPKLNNYLDRTFKAYEVKYDVSVADDDSFQTRLRSIIESAHKKSGHRVAVLIDEYDYPLLHSWGTHEHEKCASVYREVFAILKAADADIRFAFITGITKFTQISLFSALNNLVNISFKPEYERLCGISEQEMFDCFAPEIKAMAEANCWTEEETVSKLKESYDGYHFSRKCAVDIYNPFSLVYAFSENRVGNYWVSSGSTSMLPKFVSDMEIRLGDFDNCEIDSFTLESSDVTCDSPEIFLYQSGYLTIKSFDGDIYTLGFPNTEVRVALYKVVLPILTMRSGVPSSTSTQAQLFKHLRDGRLHEAMTALKALVADVPYSNMKLACMNMEERYRLIISTILNAIGLRVEVERMLATGRVDVVASSLKFTYVIELKLQNNGGLAAAVNQITENNYLEPFQGAGRKVIGLAIELDDLGKGLTAWREVGS